MRNSTVCSSAAIVVTALIAVLAPTAASAAPQQLDCVLTDTETQPGSESRAIAVVFDEDAKTLQAQDGSQHFSFSNISISNVAINGEADSVSLGIDRSSLGIVWQQYAVSKVVIEYGQCRQPDHPAADASH